MHTIVSITPCKIEADSRTYKQAESFSRFGFNSIVVELNGSKIDTATLPFQLCSIYPYRRVQDQGNIYDSKDNNKKGILKRFINKLRFCKGLLLLLRDQLFAFRKIPAASLYYLHHYRLFPAVFLRSKIHRARIIYDAHDFYPVVELSSESNPLIIHLSLALERFCIRRAHAVVTVCEGVSRMYQQKYGCNPIIIRNVQELRTARSPAKSLRERLGLRDKDLIIVVIGNAKQGIAFQCIIEAMKLLPQDVHIAFVGRGYKDYQSILDDNALTGRVHCPGAVRSNEVIKFVESANISLIAYYALNDNYKFCLPNGFFQSISAGLPVLYPRLPEIQKVAETYDIGMPVDIEIPSSIVEATNKLINVPGLMERYRSNVLKARTFLNWEMEEKSLSNLVATVVDKGVN